MFLIPIEQAPPDDKPWLLSSRSDLEEDKVDLAHFSNIIKKQCPFPGANASLDAKLAWTKKVQITVDDINMDTLWQNNIPDADDVITEVLETNAPPKIWLEFYVDKAKFREEVKDVDPELFRKGLPKYGCKEYQGETSWDAYTTWLEVQDGRKNDSHGQETVVCFGRVECSKDTAVGVLLGEMMKNLSLYTSWTNVIPLDLMKYYKEGCPGMGQICETLGKNIFYPVEGGLGIKLLLQFKAPTKIGLANTAFTDALNKIKKHCEENGKAKTYLLMEKPAKKGSKKNRRRKDDSEEDDEEYKKEKLRTAETMDVIWLPASFVEERKRVSGAFRGEDETKAIQNRIDKGNTDSGNLIADIFISNFEHIKTYKDNPSKFCGALALTIAAANSPFWMHDNESPEQIASGVRLLSTYWRTNLLKKSDEELGLGLEGYTTSSELAASYTYNPNVGDDMSESRRGLYTLLESLARNFDDVPTYGAKIALKWKPGKPRKRKESPKSVLDVERSKLQKNSYF